MRRKKAELGEYAEAHRRAYAWAEKALYYRKVGRASLAKAAVARTEYWLRRIKTLEFQAAKSKAGVPRSLASHAEPVRAFH